MKKLLDHFRAQGRRLLELRDTPHAIAGGVAIGIFWGFMPLLGLKTLLTLVTAWLARCSKIAAVIAVCLHDMLLPILPALMVFQYEIGYWLISHPHHLPPAPELHHHPEHFGQILANVLHWKTFLRAGIPLLVGSAVIAVPAAAVSYFVTLALLRRRTLKPLSPGA